MMQRLLSRTLGPFALVTSIATVVMGIWITPPDEVQGDLARLLYIHPALAWVALYLSFGTATVASALYLWPRTRSMTADRIAEASVEVSTLFIALTLITGSIWGRPTWGVWWVWDARLTSTAVLGVFMLGILALRRANDDPTVRAKRSAVLVLLTALNVPIVHFSVLWWKTVHQGATVFTDNRDIKIHGSMAWTLLLSFIALSLVFSWMVRTRYRIATQVQSQRDVALDAALAQRRQEGAK
jgi:heme exporter protein C